MAIQFACFLSVRRPLEGVTWHLLRSRIWIHEVVRFKWLRPMPNRTVPYSTYCSDKAVGGRANFCDVRIASLFVELYTSKTFEISYYLVIFSVFTKYIVRILTPRSPNHGEACALSIPAVLPIPSTISTVALYDI